MPDQSIYFRFLLKKQVPDAMYGLQYGLGNGNMLVTDIVGTNENRTCRYGNRKAI